ncbi:MAG: hypothetical protein Q8R36_02215 [bacterium]|nr:hypothetical protein [bacterium]
MLFYTKKVFTSSRSAQKKRRYLTIRASMLTTLILLLLGALSVASWMPEINIHTIQVIGNTTVSEEDIRAYIEKRIAGKYLYVFSRANVFLFQSRIIERELFETFKKIKEVELSRDTLTSVRVNIKERKPYYLWCDNSIPSGDIESCYFLDIDGYAFAPAPYFSGHVYFTFLKKFESESKTSVGTMFLPEGEFKRLISFRNTLRERELDAHSLEVLETGDYAFLLSGGTKIIFQPTQDLGMAALNLAATFDTEQFIKKKKSGLSLEYVDVRFDNKVYYRFR